ncbi:MAG: HEAT repeat domain-containing protein, partial [Methanothermobacter wolfeii]|nr:HEAT repeat domain-containing protein [Methanothermobacter wolfeii]
MDLQAEEDVELIIKALEDKHDDVRWKAAKKLGEMGDKGAAEPLIKALEDEDVFFVKGRIALALGRIGDKRAVESLIRTLKHEDEDVRGKAALALGRIGDKRA